MNVFKKQEMNTKAVLTTYVPLIVLVLITLFFQIISQGKLLSKGNIIALLNAGFTICIGGIGVSFLMAQGNLDFSMGSVAGLAAALSGFSAHINPFLSIIVGILVGAICGLVNGIIHTQFNVPSIITTLSTAFIFRGIQQTLITTGAVSLPGSMMRLENVNLKLVVLLVLLVTCGILFSKMRLGKFSKFIGSRIDAAYQSGIQITKMKIGCFVIAGCSAGLVGFFFLVRAASVSANTGVGYEFDVLLAMLLGGVPIAGGTGAKFRGVIIGSLIITILSNGMTLWGLDSVLQQFIRGIIFLISVSLSFDRSAITVIE